jgi:hypothetical protein
VLTTRYFVFIHVQKTGGKFIKSVCREHLPADWFVPNSRGDHAGIRQIPPECADLPAFASIRNPWDWYVSWYHFTRQRERWPADYDEGSDWRWAFDSGRASFKEAVSALCGAPLAGGGSGTEQEPRWAGEARKHDWDLYSHWCNIVLREGPETGRIEMGRYERLTDDFMEFLQRHRIDPGAGFEQALRTAPRINTSERGPYRDYYDEELRELVRYKARGIVERYGYEF